MTNIDHILSEVLREIIPTNQEIDLINNITEKLEEFLDKKAQELKIKYNKIEPQGSTGIKKTQLKNDFDIDLFIGLDYNLYKSKYRGLSKSKLKKESKKDFLDLCNNWIIKSLTSKEFSSPRLLYAEHPYVTVDYIVDNVKIKIDIVLYFDLDKKFIGEHGPITAVDRSPWHGRFIRDKLSAIQKNDVRLLKQFFKSCHCYGDTSAAGKVGFIGYSAELLIYYFGDIQNLFRNFHNLNKKPLDYFKRTNLDLQKIQHFQDDYLIIIDPIDKNRNVASAISERAYKFCNHQINEFLKKPSIEFFKITPLPEAKLIDKEDPILSHIYIVELKNTNREIHYTIIRDKLYSLGESIKSNGEKEFSHVERFGNIIFELYFENEKNEYNLVFYCEKPQISQTYVRKGPPKTEKKHIDNFKRKNPSFFEKDGHLWVETTREFTDFFKFVKNFLEERIPDNLQVIHMSRSFKVYTTSGKRAIYVLKNMILPFYI